MNKKRCKHLSAPGAETVEYDDSCYICGMMMEEAMGKLSREMNSFFFRAMSENVSKLDRERMMWI